MELNKTHIRLNEENEFTFETESGHIYQAKVHFTDVAMRSAPIEIEPQIGADNKMYRCFERGEDTIELKATIVGKMTRTTKPVDGNPVDGNL